MKKYMFLISVWLFMLTACTQAQSNINIDTLKKLLVTKIHDSTKSLIYCDLCLAYLYFNPDSSLFFAQKGLILAKRIDFAKGEAMALTRTAGVFRVTGSYVKALELYLQALKKYESINDQLGITRVLINIGSTYAGQGDYKQTLYYNLKAKAIAEKLKDKKRLQIALVNSGDAYEKLNQLDSARMSSHQGYEIALSLNDEAVVGTSLNNLGNVYSKMNQPILALEIYRSSIPIELKTKNDEGICETYLGMAKLFQRMNVQDSSLQYAKQSLAIAQLAGFTPKVLEASTFLAAFYKSQNIVDSAYHYLAETIAAKDSLYSQEKSRQVQALSFNELLRQQEIETVRIATEKQQKNDLQYIGIAAGLIIFITIFILLSRSIIVNERLIKFVGLIGLLVIFEFVNLLIHPYLTSATHHSPIWMLIVLVAIAAILVPMHRWIEHLVAHKIVTKNKQLRLEAARRTIAKLEGEMATKDKD